MRLKLCWAAVAVALAIAGCGGGDSDSSSSASGSASGSQTTKAAPGRTLTILHHVNRLAKPRNPGPHPGAKIDHLIVRELRKGQGSPLQAGDTGMFDFIGTNYVTGRPLDSSWQARRPFESVIDHGVVIDGWWQGIPGMRVGGRRQLIIPPSLGFASSPDLSLRGITTYFDVVLLEIRKAQPVGLGGGGGGGESGQESGAAVSPE
jgi:hypothetical protein